MFDDGKVVAQIESIEEHQITVTALNGGTLTSHKGMNLPDSPLSLPCLTEKDLEDLSLGMELKVDAVALSFVRSPEDIDELREEIAKRGSHRPMIFSKIERAEAIDRIDEIIDKSDGIMVARGDMAVELGVEKVPGIQKRLIRLSHRAGIPSITATQMLESMTRSPLPTRAEASDVANAIFDGSDAIMLSNETAVGEHPVRVVETMSQIALQAEKASSQYGTSESLIPPRGSVVDSVEFSAGRIAEATGAEVIIPLTNSGRAAQVLSKYRPMTPILAMTDREKTFHRLAFFWGVHAMKIKTVLPTDDIFAFIEKELKELKAVETGDRIVTTMGLPTMSRGTTNTVRVHTVG
jgi:pyruvate kinase